MAKYYGIIAAAGIGERFGSNKPKQYEKLGNQTILELSIGCLLACDAIEQIIVVLRPDDLYWQELAIANHPKIQTTIGGKNRSDSVINGLMALMSQALPDDFVFIHDAARPFVPKHDIITLLEAVKNHDVGGILATPVADTLKYSADGKTIEKTVERNCLYRALTPQCFRYAKLLNALMQLTTPVTDESMALELTGFSPLLIMGDPKNIKITYPGDLQPTRDQTASPIS
ncbi:MAG: 2-C-methyl-D-erythritol 4-phosphate cytidylyltransferase [Gammaproteobacteria bacterium]|nr:2-C-methyl-D-erythritol 4-phosphate cytidylyltransferase [Gammaproteobacteria bacterium]